MPRVVPSQVVTLIDQLFSEYGAGSKEKLQHFNRKLERCYGLQAVLDLTDQIPPSLLVLNNHDYSELVCSIAAIRTVMKNPVSLPHAHGFNIELGPIAEFGNVNPLTLVREHLNKCPDEFPSPGTTDLSFIEDTVFRDSLRNDIGTINRALSDSEWKGSTVLAGSVVETLLLWALRKIDPDKLKPHVSALVSNHIFSRTPPLDLEKWNLHEYIEVSRRLNLITEDTANQSRLAKDFRNLIHPGRSQRLGQACNRATALSAVAAVEHVVQDLTP